MLLKGVSAEVITCPGGLGDAAYPALEIRLPNFESPYVLTLALPAIVYRALSDQMDPLILYGAIASAVNSRLASIDMGQDGAARGRALTQCAVADAAIQQSDTKV